MKEKLLMDNVYQLGDHRIQVRMENGVIRIKNDIHLWQLFDRDVKQRTHCLIDRIKADYRFNFGKPLQIHAKSIAIEIWGHLYYEYLLLRICRLLHIDPSTKKVKRLLRPSTIIDCGEKGKDSNRFIWDISIPFYRLISSLLPKNISAKDLKR